MPDHRLPDHRLPADPSARADAPRWPTVRCLVRSHEAEVASDRLWQTGATGVEERDVDDGVELQAGFPSEQAARDAIAVLDPSWAPAVDVVVGDEWLDTWREDFDAFRVGPLLVVPAWRDVDVVPRPADTVVRLDPGRAFGTGAHASTALVLGALPGLVRGRSVLDVGCGSGVLSVAAALLGAAHVVAVDIDDEALRVTSANAARNGVTAVVEPAGTSVADVAGRFDVVLANILAPVLIELAPALVARLAPGGTLVLSGLIDTQIERVLAAYAPRGPVERLDRAPWVALVLSG